jgi:glycosyltransferase involved in cell wall biosynthesis
MEATKLDMVQLGVDHHLLSRLPAQEKRYDACFVAALSPVRGILDIVPVWKLVVAARPDATIAVIGRGNKDCEEYLHDQVKTAGLSRNVIFLGYLRGPELFQAIKRARIFVSLNREASWGLAITEAMACGLPVVAYNLDAYDIYQRGIVKVTLDHHSLFAQAVLTLLDDHRRILQLGEEAQSFTEKLDWEIITEHELQAYARLVVSRSAEKV